MQARTFSGDNTTCDWNRRLIRNLLRKNVQLINLLLVKKLKKHTAQ